MSFMRPSPGELNQTAVVSRVRDFIERHYAEGISLAQVAQAMHYSPAHLTYVVRKHTGRPVTAWIIQRRLMAARERLLKTAETVTAVAEAVGFRDAAYFTRQFSRAHGETPTRWRLHYLARPDVRQTCPTCGTDHFFEAAG